MSAVWFDHSTEDSCGLTVQGCVDIRGIRLIQRETGEVELGVGQSCELILEYKLHPDQHNCEQRSTFGGRAPRGGMFGVRAEPEPTPVPPGSGWGWNRGVVTPAKSLTARLLTRSQSHTTASHYGEPGKCSRWVPHAGMAQCCTLCSCAARALLP